MLDDRPYMRPEEPRFRGPSMQQPWSGWTILLTINVVVFLLQVMVDPSSLATHMPRFEKSIVGQWLALDSGQISWLLPMQLFTYQFLHGGVWHLLMNGLGLFFIGRALEPSIGRREVIGLYLVSGVVGALFQLGFAAVFPAQFAGPMVGASAGVFGFMGVLARLFPYREVYLLPLPIRLKLHWVFWGSFAIAMVSILAAIRTEAGDSVAHAAHLGGLLYGAFYVAKLVRNGGFMRFLPGMPRIRFVSGDSAAGSTATRRRSWRKPKVVDAAEVPEVAEGDFMSREVDPILDKISKQGIHSLTERERKILDKAKSKM